MEWVVVTYPEDRSVYIDGQLGGITNCLMAVGEGTHDFDLGKPVDYTPISQSKTVSGTLPGMPMTIAFSKAQV